MEAVFLKVLNMSITAGWLVLAVLLMRLLLKKAPRFLVVIMWALVGIRLVLPFSFESVLSMIPSTETVPSQILYDRTPEIQTGINALNSAINPVISQSFAPAPMNSVNPLQVITWLAAWIWMIGIAAMGLYTLISYLRIYRRVREAAPLQENVCLCDWIDTPFIFGLFRPRIYLPSAMAAEDIPYVIAHEQAHLQRRDHLWKPLGFLLLTIHWFNPLLWVAYILLCRDIEVACDEKVLKIMGEGIKKPYSQALVNCSVPRRAVAACPLAFGEVSVKSRVKNVLHYKKPAFWLLIAAVVVCIVLSVCFLTNPQTVNERMQIFLDCQIAEHHQSEKSVGRACCLDYEILGTKKRGNTTTVYMWVLYEEYSYDHGQLQQENGFHTPTVITTAKVDGNYQLVEYWEPRDGTYYPEDIRAKFPWYLHQKALNSQRYIGKQQAACLEMAEQYFSENPPVPETTEETDSALRALRKKYPQYFDLPTSKGLEVYVWQMAEDSYYWALLPGRNMGYFEEDFLTLEPVSLEDMRKIVDSYQLDRSMVFICPIKMSYSSYYYVIDDTYQKKVEDLFWFDLDIDKDALDGEHVFLDYPHITVELSYYGNSWNSLTITDPEVCTYLAEQVSLARAAGQQAGSSKGYYGVPYVISLYQGGQEVPILFALWDQETYSDPAHKDSEGYEYFYKADLSELYAYLETNYPAEFWYGSYDDVTVSFAGDPDSNAIYAGALNRDKMAISSVRHLPIFKFDTSEDLEQFRLHYIGASNSDAGWDEVPAFNAVVRQYDDTFFARYSLLLVYVTCGNCTHRFDVGNVLYERDTLRIQVRETTGATEVDDAEAAWFITVAVPDHIAANCSEFDATMEW